MSNNKNEQINYYDEVKVVLFIGENTEKSFDGKVLHIPNNFGEPWIFLDGNKHIRYVRDYVQIIKLQK